MTGAVLIVDDDDALSENLAEIIATLGVETAVARDRKTALARAEERDFDVALIDVRLPDGDGMSLLEPLRARSPFTQLVLVTGNATLEGAIAAVRGGAFAYVLKPVSASDLLETVRRALGQSALLRQAEHLRVELERSEHRHRDLVESIPAFVLALDEGGRITTWNRRLEQVTGYTRGEMLGADGTALIGTDENPRALPLKAGGAREVRWRRAEVAGAGSTPIVHAVGIDVTDEQEMLRRTLRAERLAAVGTMAAGLAHEIRNPLNSASLQLTLLERRLGRGDGAEITTPIIRIIKSEIDRLEALLRDFLAFSKPRPLEASAVDVAELVGAVVDLIGPEAEAAQVKIVVEKMQAIPPVRGEPGRLRQVLLNLTRNAIEAMQARGGLLTLRARSVRDAVEIDVEDDGPGFSQELPVFDAFFTTKVQGTGLGLSLAHRIVADHGGVLQVESRPGKTCFTIALTVTARS
jgi:signal transduction histidine kinase